MAKKDELLKLDVKWGDSIRAAAQCTIVDKSFPRTYEAGLYKDIGGTIPCTEAMPGDIVYVVVKTTNIEDGTRLSLRIDSTPIDGLRSTNDYNGNNFIVNNNKAYITLEVTDLSTHDVDIVKSITVEGVDGAYNNPLTITLVPFVTNWSDNPNTIRYRDYMSGETIYTVITNRLVPNNSEITVSLSLGSSPFVAASITDNTLTKTVKFTNGKAIAPWTIAYKSTNHQSSTLSPHITYKGMIVIFINFAKLIFISNN